MPLLDLSVEALYQYEGRNPRPDGFDAFWDEALRELGTVPPRVELVRHELAAPFAECFHLTFDGIDGARQYAKFLRPKIIEAPSPCVLEFHGYTGSSGDWMSKLPFVARGQAVASLDCRGQGGRSQDRSLVTGNTHNGHIIRGLDDALSGHPAALYYRQMFLDTAQLARAVSEMPEIDGARLGARGGSQGGALTLACAALSPIKKAASMYPFLSDYKRVWEMDLAQGAYAELKSWFRAFDPLHEREDAVWNALGFVDIQHLAPRIESDVLMAVGLMDSICPPSTQFAAFNKIKGNKRAVFFPDFGHEGCRDGAIGNSIFWQTFDVLNRGQKPEAGFQKGESWLWLHRASGYSKLLLLLWVSCTNFLLPFYNPASDFWPLFHTRHSSFNT